MRLQICQECEYYIMDDGREVYCKYDRPRACYPVRPGRRGGEIYHCPRESDFEKKYSLKNQQF